MIHDDMRILIIEDEPTVAEVVAAALTHHGHQTTLALAGTDGLERIVADRPDAVFLDIVMPGLSGVGVLREIRRRAPDLPVIVLSGRADSQALGEARRLGVTAIVLKPWALHHLDEALRTLDMGREPTPST
jgi:two-component system response regulator MprA